MLWGTLGVLGLASSPGSMKSSSELLNLRFRLFEILLLMVRGFFFFTEVLRLLDFQAGLTR